MRTEDLDHEESYAVVGGTGAERVEAAAKR